MLVTPTKSYFTELASAVKAHEGAAVYEVALLDRIESGAASGPSGLLGDTYRAAIEVGPPVCRNAAEGYRLTHMVLFATDFGRIKVSVSKTTWRAEMQRLVREFRTNLDLFGEILMAARCLDMWERWAVDAAKNDFWPRWVVLDRSPAVFAENYHPILVGGLLSALVGS